MHTGMQLFTPFDRKKEKPRKHKRKLPGLWLSVLDLLLFVLEGIELVIPALLLRMEGVSDEEVWEACRYVNADSFISRLEGGLDEVVRERGNNFSAGQRQLLSFARTILHKPSVMILDEATANIDMRPSCSFRTRWKR